MNATTAELGRAVAFGAGATLPADFYEASAASFGCAEAGESEVVYTPQGSGAGQKALLQNSVDFCGTDVPFSGQDLLPEGGGAGGQEGDGNGNANANGNGNGGGGGGGGEQDIRMYPTVATAVCAATNVQLKGMAYTEQLDLVLSRSVLADIFSGRITHWNHSAILADNANVAAVIPGTRIQLVVRSDSSGTTSIFTRALAKFSAEFAAGIGSGKVVTWPAGSKAYRGNSGVSAAIASTPGSIGYTVVSDLKQAREAVAASAGYSGPDSAFQIRCAALKPADEGSASPAAAAAAAAGAASTTASRPSRPMPPIRPGVAEVLRAIEVGTAGKPTTAYVDLVSDAVLRDPRAWPISSFTFIAVRGNTTRAGLRGPDSCAVRGVVVQYLSWIWSAPQSAAQAARLSFVTVSPAVGSMLLEDVAEWVRCEGGRWSIKDYLLSLPHRSGGSSSSTTSTTSSSSGGSGVAGSTTPGGAPSKGATAENASALLSGGQWGSRPGCGTPITDASSGSGRGGGGGGGMSNSSTLASKKYVECRDVEVIGPVPAGLTPPSFPQPTAGGGGGSSGGGGSDNEPPGTGPPGSGWGALVLDGILLATLVLVEHLSNAALYAAKGGYQIDADREMIAVGAANIFSSVFGGFAAGAGFSRSVVNAEAGASSMLASGMSGFIVFLLLQLIADYLYFIPKAVISTIILISVLKLVDVKTMIRLWKTSKLDLLAFSVAFFVSLFQGIVLGIAVAVGTSLLLFVAKTIRPRIVELGRVPGTVNYERMLDQPSSSSLALGGGRGRGAGELNKDEAALIQTRRVKVVRFEAPLFFANVELLCSRIERECSRRQMSLRRRQWNVLVLDFSSVDWIDVTAADKLTQCLRQNDAGGVAFCFSSVRDSVRRSLLRFGVEQTVAERLWFPSVHTAVKEALQVGVDSADDSWSGSRSCCCCCCCCFCCCCCCCCCCCRYGFALTLCAPGKRPLRFSCHHTPSTLHFADLHSFLSLSLITLSTVS